MGKVVITGGGWAGCSAAISARKQGAEVVLLERTDMLLGTGLVGGIMRNNGRYTATEEMIAMGAGELFEICDINSRHTHVEFPGNEDATLYDVVKTHSEVLKYIRNLGVQVFFMSRITKVDIQNKLIHWIQDQKNNRFDGDVFIDATGTAGPLSNCSKFGNGCVMCVLRCPSFGGRVSLTGLCGIKEMHAQKADGSNGSMSGSFKLSKESLSLELQKELEKKGVVVIPIPHNPTNNSLDIKACQQYSMKEFKENLIILDTGYAKVMTPYFSLEDLREIPGFESIRYEDPYAGGKGNSMRFFDVAPRDNFLRVEGVENLLCCGEKAGPIVGHTEAIVTGTLAGYNSVMLASKRGLLELPDSLAAGDLISFVKTSMATFEGIRRKYTFSGSFYFERMKELGLYTRDKDLIYRRVANCGLSDIFSKIPNPELILA